MGKGFFLILIGYLVFWQILGSAQKLNIYLIPICIGQMVKYLFDDMYVRIIGKQVSGLGLFAFAFLTL